MVKIAVVCANGRAGKLITNEAVSRGLDVTAIAKDENQTNAQKFILKDLFDLTKDDLKNFDIIIDAFGTWTEDSLYLHSKSLNYLCDLLSNSEKRLLVVGGAGSLYVNPDKTVQLYQTPDFSKMYIPVAKAQADELDELRKRNDVKWTFVSPAADFRPDGERTGKYILNGEIFTLNSKGESIISFADYAIAMVDEAVSGNHIQQRISVVQE